MSEPSTLIKEGWMVLAEGGRVSQVLPVGCRIPAGEIVQGLTPEGLRRILIPLADGPGPEDRISAGVKLRNIRADLGAGTDDYLEVRCELPRLNDLFDDLAGEMVSAVVQDPAVPGATCIAVLDRWRALLRSVKGQGPSRSSVVGLLGELVIAERIVKADPERRMDMWVGREGQRHDFRRGQLAIECKSTLQTKKRTFSVHGIGQLEEPEGGELYLAWMRFEHVPGGRLSISGMISRITALGVPSELVHTGMDERGFPPGTWGEEDFELLELSVYRVGGGFPRIVSSQIDEAACSAISDLTYTVDLDVCPEPIDPEQMESVFAEMAGVG